MIYGNQILSISWLFNVQLRSLKLVKDLEKMENFKLFQNRMDFIKEINIIVMFF